MPTNFYFNNFQNSMEQNLIEDLIIESIKIYGIEVLYMPRTMVAEDMLFGEDALSKFEFAYPLEMYIKNVSGFEGEGDFLSKFGLQIRDEMTLTVSRRRFGEEINLNDTTKVNEAEGIGRPAEGDLIFFPLNNELFEVKFVEHEAIFYQMGSLQTYDLRVEMFEYSSEKFDTGIPIIDGIDDRLSTDSMIYSLLDEDGNTLVDEDGNILTQESFRIEDYDNSANNEYFQTESETLNFIDFSEINPFSERGTW